MRYMVAICGSLVALAGWLFVSYGTARTSIQVMDAWVRATTGSSAVVHAIIANRGVNKDRLVRVSSRLAEKFVVLDNEGHEIESLRIPADSELVLGGDLLRIEAFGLAQAIKAGENFPMLFVFEHAGKVTVFARVEKLQSVGKQ
jgi:copper(I)-binding protein